MLFLGRGCFCFCWILHPPMTLIARIFSNLICVICVICGRSVCVLHADARGGAEGGSDGRQDGNHEMQDFLNDFFLHKLKIKN